MTILAQRVLAAVRFFDRANDESVTAPLAIEATGAYGVRNRSGLWVIRAADGVPPDAPDAVPAGSVRVEARVSDPSGRYLARAFSIAVPRVADLFEPVSIELPPSAAAPLRATWASVRVQVRFEPSVDAPDGTPIEGALVRLEREGQGVRCQTLSDARGEALAIGPGIEPFAAGDDESVIAQPSSPHQLEVVIDLAATDPSTGRRAELADPDALWTRRESLRRESRALSLAAGELQIQVIDVPRN